jgi:hypothetical protein
MVFRELWARIAPGAPGLTHDRLESLSRLAARSRGGARIALPGRWSAESRGGWVRFTRARITRREREQLDVQGRARWQGGSKFPKI